MYTLGGGINEEQGWGRADETFRRQGGAGRVRRRARVVRARRPGLRHPHRPHADDRRRLSAQRRHRGAVRALEARRAAAADVRRPRRDPCRDRRRGRRAQGRPLPGVLGAAARLRARARRGARRRGPGQARARACWRPSPTADVDPLPAVQPGRQRRHDPRRARASGRPSPTPGCRWSASPPSSGTRPCAAWPTRCWPRWASSPPPRPSPSTTAPGCWTAGWSTPWTRARSSEVEAAGIRCRAVPLMMTDLDATDRDGARGAGAGRGGPGVSDGRRPRRPRTGCGRCPGCPRCGRATTSPS